MWGHTEEPILGHLLLADWDPWEPRGMGKASVQLDESGGSLRKAKLAEDSLG